jgi:hypothetical protein
LAKLNTNGEQRKLEIGGWRGISVYFSIALVKKNIQFRVSGKTRNKLNWKKCFCTGFSSLHMDEQ